MAGQRRSRDLTLKGKPHAGGQARGRAEARLWTGPVAHLLGGALDVLEALGRYGLARLGSGPGRGRRDGRR